MTKADALFEAVGGYELARLERMDANNACHDDQQERYKRQLVEASNAIAAAPDEAQRQLAMAFYAIQEQTYRIFLGRRKIELLREGLEPSPGSLALSLATTLFEQIYEPDEKRFDAEAVLELLDYAVAQIPLLGSVYDAARAVESIKNARRYEHEAAETYVWYLESYIESLRLWCVSADALIEVCKQKTQQ